MIDLALLRILKYKKQFLKLQRFIPTSALDGATKAVVADIDRYFKDSPDEDKIDPEAFRSLFFNTYHKNLKPEQVKQFTTILKNMEKDTSDAVAKTMINSLTELEFATLAANVLSDYEAGEDIDVTERIGNLLEDCKVKQDKSTELVFADVEDSTIGETDDNGGLKWHIDAMNEIYRNILAGDQYIVAGRPGKGKTTFITHLNWSMAQAMPQNKIIMWFNNESRRQRIMSRQIQSALNKTDDELAEMRKDGTLTEAYTKAMGRGDRVRVYDVHGMSTQKIEGILEGVGIDNVGAIVFDMLDKITSYTPRDQREDQRLEKLCDWSRDLGVKYNCPMFPTSQISNEGANLLFPTENMLKDSKTGKQGACDGIIMIGCDDDPLTPHTRGLSMPKTKSKRAGQSDMREEVLLDADRGRYLNP